ncbi:MAG: type II secretion system GspH family protein [Verrucomicrobia subdivision 3 bacterium]|nr:type II secretion system GspH family protein [Limisphaerales bacterium]
MDTSSILNHDDKSLAGESPPAFTLIELLVLIAVIAMLAAILLPVLSRVKDTAARVQCLNNVKQIGHAVFLYTEDHEDFFPLVEDWPAFGGRRGTTGVYNSNAYDPTNRPLNEYVGYQLEVFHCPRDKGDALNGVNLPLWEAYGNSYIMQLGASSFRTQYILAMRNGTYGPPVRVSTIHRTENKIVVSEWPFHANRPLTDSRTQWHNRGQVRAFNIYFADSHADYFKFPSTYGPADEWIAPDPAYLWW